MHPPLKKIENESSLKKEIKASKKSRLSLSFVRRAFFLCKKKRGLLDGRSRDVGFEVVSRANGKASRDLGTFIFPKEEEEEEEET